VALFVLGDDHEVEDADRAGVHELLDLREDRARELVPGKRDREVVDRCDAHSNLLVQLDGDLPLPGAQRNRETRAIAAFQTRCRAAVATSAGCDIETSSSKIVRSVNSATAGSANCRSSSSLRNSDRHSR